MKRKKLILIIITCFIVIGVVLTVGISKKIQKEKQIAQNLLPSVTLVNYHTNQDFNISYNQNNKPTILLFGSLDCENCIHTILHLCNDTVVSDNANLYIIVPNTKKSIDYHIEEYNLNNAVILIDSLYFCYDKFDIVATPTTYIYDKQQRYVVKFQGEFPTNRLRKYL